jgi:Heterokaryon incompatibility protein (HET)
MLFKLKGFAIQKRVVAEPPLLDQLQYEALSKPQNIRLLHTSPGDDSEEIRCSLVEADWATNPSYEALSYTWGSPEVGKSIICNGRHASVSINLFHALRQIRRPDIEVIFWIDQLCMYPDRSRTKSCRNLRFAPLFCEGFGFRI